MGKSRSQIAQQLVSLLSGVTSVFASGSVLESTQPADNHVASGLTFPIAVVSTLEADADPEDAARFDVARFRVSVAAGAVTEADKSSNLASGGTASSQHVAENAVRDLLASLNPSPGYAFVDSVHGFQGVVEKVSPARLVEGRGTTHAVVDLTVAAFNATRFDT